jgi:hypothetical protein
MVAQRVNSPQEARQNGGAGRGRIPYGPRRVENFMTSIDSEEELVKARYEVERALTGPAELQLLIGDEIVATLSRGRFEFSVEWGKLIFSWWGEGVSQSWRVTAYELDRDGLRLQVTRGMGRERSLLILRDPARKRDVRETMRLSPGDRRKLYAETLSRLITNTFDGVAVRRASPVAGGAGRRKYARLLLKMTGETGLAIGVGALESQADIDGVIAAGLVWLARFNGNRIDNDRAKWLWICLPKGRSQTGLERLTLLDLTWMRASVRCLEVDEDHDTIMSVRPAAQDELLNSHPHELLWPENSTLETGWRDRIVNLAPDLIETRRSVGGGERFLINGLEFARFSAGGRVKFGVAGQQPEVVGTSVPLTEANFGDLEGLAREILRRRSAKSADRRHPFYLLRSEAWLESLLRRNIRRLDPTLDDRFVYSQIPAWRANERSVIDLLTVTDGGRLVVIEIKAAEDPQLPLQGADYWLRVEQGRLRGEFTKRGLFHGVLLSDQSPLLYLVAPRLRFHRSFAAVAQCLTPRIEAYQIGINVNWREGVRVHTRERVNVG